MAQTKQINTPHPKKVIFKNDNELFEIKKKHSDYQLYQLAQKESYRELCASREKLKEIEKRLSHVSRFDKLFRKNKIVSLNQEKQTYQQKINFLQTIIRTQYQALNRKSIGQLKNTHQAQLQKSSLKRSNKEYAR